MRLSIKSVLPLLLGASPLLIAAAPPSASTTARLACGLDPVQANPDAEVELTAARRNPNAGDSGVVNAQRPIAHPIVTSFQALVTSEQEWSNFLDRAVSAASSYWRETPNYSLQFATDAANTVPAQPRCTAFEISDVEGSKSDRTELKNTTKEDPGADAETPMGTVVDDIPLLEPATGEALPPERVEPIGLDPETAPVAAPVSSEDSATSPALPLEPQPVSQPATLPLTPAPPAVEAVAAPGFDPYNFTPNAPAPTPFDGTVPDSLQNLPDGSYRYLEGRFENRNYSDDVLRANGGSVFLLTKKGADVVGRLMPRLGEPGVCVDGTLNGNTVTGTAYPEVAIEGAEAAKETLVDLNDFSRINAGSAIAPTACLSPAPATDNNTPESSATESES